MLLTTAQRDSKVSPYCKNCRDSFRVGMTAAERTVRQLSETRFKAIMAELAVRTRSEDYQDAYSFGLYRDDEQDEGREDLR